MNTMNALLLTAILVLGLSCSGGEENADKTPKKEETTENSTEKKSAELQTGFWVNKKMSKGLPDNIENNYIQLKKEGDNWLISMSCDMETFDAKLEKSDNSFKAKGLTAKLNSEALEINFSNDFECSVIEKKVSYIFVPDCTKKEHLSNVVYFSGNYNSDKGELILSADGGIKGWNKYKSYRFSNVANAPTFVVTDDKNKETAYIIEAKDKNFELYEVLNQEEAFDLEAELKKGKKVISLIRK
jgi:hypothetical protein